MQRPRCWYFRNEEFVCFKKGGSRCFAVDGENQYHAIFGRRSVPHRPPVEPGGAVRRLRREVPRRSDRTASARSRRPSYFTMPTLQNVLKENVLEDDELADARDPAGAGQREDAGTTRCATSSRTTGRSRSRPWC